MNNTTSPRKRLMSMLVRAGLAIGALWLLFQIVDPSRVAAAIRQAAIAPVLLSLLLVPVHLSLRAGRWYVLLHAIGISESFSYAFRVVLAGYAFSSVTPAEVGDFLVRTRFHHHGSGGALPALVLVDKILQGLFILLFGLSALVAVFTHSPELALLAFLALFLASVVLVKNGRRLLKSRLVLRLATRMRADQGVDVLSQIPRKIILLVIAFTLATLLAFVTQEYLLLRSLVSVSPGVAWTGYWSAMAVQFVFPFFLAGLGIREGAHVYFFGLLGIPDVAALSASLLLFGINILLPSVVGLVIFLTLPKRSISS